MIEHQVFQVARVPPVVKWRRLCSNLCCRRPLLLFGRCSTRLVAPLHQRNRLLLDLGADPNQHAFGMDCGLLSSNSPHDQRTKFKEALARGRAEGRPVRVLLTCCADCVRCWSAALAACAACCADCSRGLLRWLLARPAASTARAACCAECLRGLLR